MRKNERAVVDKLAEAWNLFMGLDTKINRDDLDDFRRSIHECQRIVMSRPEIRKMQRSRR